MFEDYWTLALEQWQNLSPEAESFVLGVGVILIAVVVGGILAGMVRRRLKDAHFDAAFRRSWSTSPITKLPDTPGFTPTRLITLLVRVTVLGAGVWILAQQHRWIALGRGLEWSAGRGWALVAVILTTHYLSRLFSDKLVEVVLASPLKQIFDSWHSSSTTRVSDRVSEREPRSSPAALVASFLADVLVVLLALLIVADLTGLTLAGSILAATWQVILHVITAGIAILVGWSGARLVHAQMTVDAAPGSSLGIRSYAAASVMGGATLLAVMLLAGNFPSYFGLFLVVLLVMLMWPAQRWLPDIYAGMLLRLQGVKEVHVDGDACPVRSVGLVQTELTHPAGLRTQRNHSVLEAHLAANGNHALSTKENE